MVGNGLENKAASFRKERDLGFFESVPFSPRRVTFDRGKIIHFPPAFRHKSSKIQFPSSSFGDLKSENKTLTLQKSPFSSKIWNFSEVHLVSLELFFSSFFQWRARASNFSSWLRWQLFKLMEKKNTVWKERPQAQGGVLLQKKYLWLLITQTRVLTTTLQKTSHLFKILINLI